MVQDTTQVALVAPRAFRSHPAGTDGTVDLLPFEEELAGIVNAFIDTADPVEGAEMMKVTQRIVSENVHAAGLTQDSAAPMVNRRFAGLRVDAATFMFTWGEDSVIREGMFVPKERQGDRDPTPRR